MFAEQLKLKIEIKKAIVPLSIKKNVIILISSSRQANLLEKSVVLIAHFIQHIKTSFDLTCNLNNIACGRETSAVTIKCSYN